MTAAGCRHLVEQPLDVLRGEVGVAGSCRALARSTSRPPTGRCRPGSSTSCRSQLSPLGDRATTSGTGRGRLYRLRAVHLRSTLGARPACPCTPLGSCLRRTAASRRGVSQPRGRTHAGPCRCCPRCCRVAGHHSSGSLRIARALGVRLPPGRPFVVGVSNLCLFRALLGIIAATDAGL